MYNSQDPSASSLIVRTTVAGEYIRGLGGYYGTHINRLEIYTNKTTLAMGQTIGTRFVQLPGS